MNTKKRILVTGGAGFIGSHMVDRLLKEGHSVIVLDNFSTGRIENLRHHEGNTNLEIIKADISIIEEIAHSFDNVDGVIHLAALADIVPSIQNPKAYFESNVVGTFNVAKLSRDSGVKRFVYAASSSCYGVPLHYPTKEEEVINPQYPYALTKRLGEEIVMHWSHVYKLPAVSLRFFNVYGPRSRTSGTYGAVFGVFLAQKLANKPFTVVGDGEQTRDFTYVTDVVDAVYTALFSEKVSEIYNVGSGKTISVNRIVELLKGEKVYIPKRPGEPDSTFADISKINRELNWKPKISIETGIDELLKRIDYWKEAPVWEPKTIEAQTKDWFKYLGNK